MILATGRIDVGFSNSTDITIVIGDIMLDQPNQIASKNGRCLTNKQINKCSNEPRLGTRVLGLELDTL